MDSESAEPKSVVQDFLKAQSERDLDRMCELVDENVEYYNEALPAEKQIVGRQQFRDFFKMSPCIWCEEADLQELRIGVDTDRGIVLTERLDRFKIDGKWLEIPICGAFDVVDGRVRRWKDYWDYNKYNAKKEALFGPGFSLFKKPAPPPPSQWVVICSPVSGKAEGRQVVEEQLLPAWQGSAAAKLSVFFTEYARHAVDLAQEHGSKDCGVIAVGGDGTVHEVIEGLAAKGVLGETPLALLPQGTMNFYSVTAGLPGVSELPELVAQHSVRPSSLIKVSDEGSFSSTAFEAFHIGRMPYRVCMGAQEWRFSFGPMFGIFLNLIGCNALPRPFCQSGTLTLHPVEGSQPIRKVANFFWIVASHRNPYNGVVGTDLWVSYMTLENFPGFGRMMEFFKPPMEHFAGLAYCFEEHVKVRSFEFVNDGAWNGCVLDGDPYALGKVVSVRDMPGAVQIVAGERRERLPDEYYDVQSLSAAAEAWLQKNPVPPGLFALEPAKALRSRL